MKHMRIQTFAMLVLAAGSAHAAPADFSSWAKTMSVRFAGYTAGGTLTNFPALVQFAEGSNQFHYADLNVAANPADLRFTDATGANELSYEIDTWNTGGVSYVWVLVPQLADTNTAIKVFYGKSSQTAPAYTTNGAVWTNVYVGVWHLGVTNGVQDLRDSTGHGLNGTSSGGGVINAPGMIGGAQGFAGNNNDHVSIPALNVTTDHFSILAWIHGHPNNEYSGIVYSRGDAANGIHYNSINPSRIAYTWNNNGAATWGWGGGPNPPDDQWAFLGLSLGPNQAVEYSISDAGGYMAKTNVLAHSPENLNSVWWIGADPFNGGGRTLTGQADEVRMALAPLAPNWIWATWYNQASNRMFNLYADAQGQNLDVPAIDNRLGATNVLATTGWLNGNLTSTGTAATAVSVYWDTTDRTTNKTWTFSNSDFGQNVATGVLTYLATGLSSNTTYWYTYYASNTSGEVWAIPSTSFKTLGTPVVDNGGGATAIGPSSATLNGNLTDGGGAHIYVLWGTNDAGTSLSGWEHTSDMGMLTEGAFSVSVSLDPGKTYYYRCYAANLVGEAWAGSTATFASINPVLYVNLAAGGANNGLNWTDAFTNLQTALDRADVMTNQIWVAKGTYNTANSNDNWNTYLITNANNLVVYGGFTNGMSGLDERNWTNNPTIIQAASGHRDIYISATNVTMDGFTIKNGYGPAPGTAINSSGKGLKFNNCAIINNGDMYGCHFPIYANANIALSGCTVTNNLTGPYNAYGGGAFFVENANLTLTGCDFFGNGYKAYQWQSGAIRVQSGISIIKNSRFAGNFTIESQSYYAPGAGGAIMFSGGTALIENCTFYTNTVPLGADTAIPNGGGGAIYVTGGAVLTVRNSIFKDDVGVPKHILADAGTVVTLAYCCFSGLDTNYILLNGTANIANCIAADPLFGLTRAYDLHEKATGGRWDPVTGAWTNDLMNSPCIDAGDPSSSYAMEPSMPNNTRINMGAYGNTPYASYAKPPPAGTVLFIR